MKKSKMSNGNGDGRSLQLDWQNLIMTVGLVLVMAGGFWTLAYIPIRERLADHDRQIDSERQAESQRIANDENKYLTQKEHNEFKLNVRDADARMEREISDARINAEGVRRDIDKIKSDVLVLSRADAQALLNTTRLEFLAEIKRLDQEGVDNMKRREFEAWRLEREKTISTILDRQNRFSEALDSMYSRVMQQLQSYPIKDH